MRQARSTHGRRASICEKFGWTLSYLMHGIAWAEVVRLLIDMPRYESGGEQKTKLTAENAESFMNLINSM